VGQDPNANRNTQEQNSQVEWVEPHFDHLFHRIFSFSNFVQFITQRGELTSPARGDSVGDKRKIPCKYRIFEKSFSFEPLTYLVFGSFFAKPDPPGFSLQAE